MRRIDSAASLFRLLATLIAFSLLPAAAHAQGSRPLTPAVKHYVVVFGFQGPLNAPKSTHSFAAFVETDATPQRRVRAVNVISWMPRSLNVSFLAGAEWGVNLSLGQSFGLAANNGRRVATFGPYEIRDDLYFRGVAQWRNLEDAARTGRILYRVNDKDTRLGVWQGAWGAAINCIHALTDIVGFVRTGSVRGEDASATIVSLYWPWVTDPRPQTWLMPRLGV